MGEQPTFNATLVIQDGLDSKELGKAYLLQVDVNGVGRIFVDVSNIVQRTLDRTLPNSGEYFVDQSSDWFEKQA